MATYSSLGPTRFDLVLKPDLVAPGSRIVSAEASGSYLSANLPDHHVIGSGPNAYMRLSGTSMATGVVSGSVALLLEENSALKPASIKAVLQLTSSFLPDAGVIRGGSGSLNALAAAEFVASSDSLDSVVNIGGESVRANGVLFVDATDQQQLLSDHSIAWGQIDTIVWGQIDTIVWGQIATIVWGQTDTIVWGQDHTVWGQNATIVWGQNDTVVWGEDFLD